MARSSTSTARPGWPGTPLACRFPTSARSARKVWAKGFRNPQPLHIRLNAFRRRATWAGVPGKSWTFVKAWGQLRLALLRGQVAARRLREHDDLQKPPPSPGHVGGRHLSRFPRARYWRCHRERPAPAGRIRTEFDCNIIFGDYVQGFIKRAQSDGSGKLTGVKDFATEGTATWTSSFRTASCTM